MPTGKKKQALRHRRKGMGLGAKSIGFILQVSKFISG